MNTWKLSEVEKEKSIQAIVHEGVISPAAKIREMGHVSRACSLRTLFFGVEDCLFLGILLTLCLWLFLLPFHPKTILCTVFGLSPFAYIVCFILTTWKEHLVQLFEIKMCCFYTLRQVIALRMIYLSLGNMFINIITLSFLPHTQSTVIPFWKTLGLSFTALFLYGILMLFFQVKGRTCLSIALPAIIWGLCNLFINFYCGNQVEKLLWHLTDTFIFIVVSCSFIAYLFMLYYFFTTTYKEEIQNAIG